jgi:hypothetical protein
MGRKELQPPRSTLRMFSGQELKTRGIFTATTQHPKTQSKLKVDFYVTEGETAILGIDACRQLDLIRIVDENICGISDLLPSSPL